MRVEKSLLKERKQKEVQAFIDANPEVQRWLRKVPSPLTKANYARDLIRYVEATGMSPTQLIALKGKAHDAEDLLDEFVDLADKADLGDSRIWSISTTVKSFYKWNYADLSRGAGKKTINKKKPYRTPDKESLLKFMEGANLRDIALIQFLSATGISEGSVPYLRWKHLWAELIEKRIDPPHIALSSVEIKGRGEGKYVGIQQHTFLTPTAVEALLKYKGWRERTKHETITPESPLFVTNEGPVKLLSKSSVRAVFIEASKRTGIWFSPHDMRRFVQTQLEFARMQPNWVKKILRHKVKGEEAPYSQPKIEELRKAYQIAVPYLDLGTTPIGELQKRQQIVEGINSKMMSGEPLTAEDKDNMTRYQIRLYKKKPKDSELEAMLNKRKKRRTEHDGGCADGEHCPTFEQINESQLLGYLQKGWQIVHKLGNGDVIVKSE